MTKKEWRRKFSSRVLQALGELDMTQSRLAIKSNVSIGMISRYLACTSTPSATVALNIAKVLGIPVNELIDFGEKVNEREVEYGQYK